MTAADLVAPPRGMSGRTDAQVGASPDDRAGFSVFEPFRHADETDLKRDREQANDDHRYTQTDLPRGSRDTARHQ
jgi:hypothetical protein